MIEDFIQFGAVIFEFLGFLLAVLSWFLESLNLFDTLTIKFIEDSFPDLTVFLDSSLHVLLDQTLLLVL